MVIAIAKEENNVAGERDFLVSHNARVAYRGGKRHPRKLKS